MLKRITLLLAVLFAVGSITTTAIAQEEAEPETESTTTTETQPAEAGDEEECD
jgi:preprotein translocase subunit SecG